MKSLIIVMVAILLTISGCRSVSQSGTYTGYTGPTISGELESNWEKIDTSKLETLLGHGPPLPRYLPLNYQIKEGYYYREPNSSPQITSIILLISDQPIKWSGNQYVCRMTLYIGWNEAGLGLKIIPSESIPNIGKLQQADNEYILWMESYGSPDSLGSTLKLSASQQFSKDELIKIAASIPGIVWPD